MSAEPTVHEGFARIGEHGPIFKLRPPHTAASLRADAERAEGERPLMCRLGMHDTEVVGDVYMGEDDDDPMEMMLALLASSDYSKLLRCGRCGRVRMRGYP